MPQQRYIFTILNGLILLITLISIGIIILPDNNYQNCLEKYKETVCIIGQKTIYPMTNDSVKYPINYDNVDTIKCYLDEIGVPTLDHLCRHYLYHYLIVCIVGLFCILILRLIP